MQPRALILHATGTNRDHDVAQALQLAGAIPEICHLNQLRRGERRWQDFQMLVLPGGFSYADALGAGRLFALDLIALFKDEVQAFIDSGKPVIGICNGFQALVKSGILPGLGDGSKPAATLTFNQEGHFECRWVTLAPVSQKCIWTRGLNDLIDCPVAHGEGRFLLSVRIDPLILSAQDQVALIYCLPDGTPAKGVYPANPNGSILDIAGVCNPQGTVLGLMPHPENHIFSLQHPHFCRGFSGRSGLSLFQHGVAYARDL